MCIVRRLGSALLVLGLIGCEDRKPLEPDTDIVPVDKSAYAASGPKLNPPSSLTASAVSLSKIDLRWTDNSTNETGFEVHRSTTGAGGTFALLASTGAGIITYSDVGLTASTQYCYKVRAFKRANGTTSYSAFTIAACATTPAPPPPPPPNAPSATDAVPQSSSTVQVSWTDNATSEAGFRVERSLDGGTSWATISTTATNVTSFQDAGRSSEQQVCYRVIAFNVGGDSPPSNPDCTTPPAAPIGLTATLVEGGAIDLAWTDNSAVEDGYEVLKSGLQHAVVADLPPNSTGYRDLAGGSLTGSATYVVLAKKDAGFSDLSNEVEVFAYCAVEECGSGDNCPGGSFCGADGCCTPHCFDGVHNGSESDVDCGGSCVPCATGQRCEFNLDCVSGSCVNNVCQP